MRVSAVLGVLAGTLTCQQILQSFTPADFYGSFTPMGDVDGDGYEDVFVTSLIFVGPYPANWDYELRLYSGKNGNLLRRGPRWAYPDQAESFPTGDHDGDGTRDYICFSTDYAAAMHQLSVRSGRDDRVLWMVQNPFTMYWLYDVIGGVDVNGDGKLDVVVSNPAAASVGTIWAYDHTGALLYQRVGAGGNYTLSQSIAALGDVNTDGCDDYIVGLGDPTWYGAVAVVSGINGQFLRIVTGQNVGDYIGGGCTGCGDLDGDGLPDFAAGGGLSGSYGSVQAFSSATGNRLFAYYSGAIGDRCGSVLRAADYDQDGNDDFFAATWNGHRVVSGRDGTLIAHHVPTSPSSFGTFESQPLRTPSGFPHFFLRTQLQGTHLMTALPRRSSVLGAGCAITAAAPPLLGMRELNTLDRRLSISGTAPGATAFLLLGLATPSPWLNLAPGGFPQCTIHPHVQVLGAFTTGAAGANAGYAHHDFVVPSASTYGAGIDAQWLVLDPAFAPAGLSAAIRFAIQ